MTDASSPSSATGPGGPRPLLPPRPARDSIAALAPGLVAERRAQHAAGAGPSPHQRPPPQLIGGPPPTDDAHPSVRRPSRPVPRRPTPAAYTSSSDNIHSFEPVEAVAQPLEDEELLERVESPEPGAPPAADEASTENAPISAAGRPGAISPGTAARRIRFRIVKLSKTGAYSERMLSLDPARGLLLFAPVDEASLASPGAVAGQQTPQYSAAAAEDSEWEAADHVADGIEDAKRFALDDIASAVVFDDTYSAPPPAALVAAGSLSAGAFSARMLLLFAPETFLRPYELLFQKREQRDIFAHVLENMYGIEIRSHVRLGEASSPGGVSPGAGGASPAPSTPAAMPVVRWIPDADCSACMQCGAAFTLIYRKHHCRSCGGIFCSACSSSQAALPDLGHSKPQRVCISCFNIICSVRKQGLMLSSAGAGHGMNVGAPGLSSPQPLSHQYGALDESITPRNAPQGGAQSGTAHGKRNSIVAGSAGRRGSLPFAPAASATSPTAAVPATPPAPRDMYGFLLSSPTLALVAASASSQREHSVMHINSAAPEGAEHATCDREEDRGNSTLPQSPAQHGVAPGASNSAPVSASGAAAAAAAAASSAAFQASLLAAQQARLALQQSEIDAARVRWDHYLALHTSIDRNSSELRRLVRRGIPPELRGQIWQILSGSRDRQAALQSAHARRYHAQQSEAAIASARSSGGVAPADRPELISESNYYLHCLARAQSPAHLSVSMAEIEKDLHRTFPDNALYECAPATSNSAPSTPGGAASSAATAPSSPPPPRAVYNSQGLTMLRRVLLAYSFHRPEIGYCQSMNFLCALLLLFMDEEDAFYMLSVICEDICCIEVPVSGSRSSSDAGDPVPAAGGPGAPRTKQLFFHSPDLAGAHIDVKVFGDLVAEKLPRVAAQFERLSFPLAPLAMGWLLCLFINTLPLETTLTVLDVLFSEGAKILHRVSLTLLKVHEKQILKCADFEELLMTIKTLPAFHPTWSTPPAGASANAAKSPAGAGAGASSRGAASPAFGQPSAAASSGGGGSDSLPTLLPPAIDTAGFMRVAFDALWLGSFPGAKIAALRLFHVAQVEEQLAMRKAKTKANKERARADKAASGAAQGQAAQRKKSIAGIPAATTATGGLPPLAPNPASGAPAATAAAAAAPSLAASLAAAEAAAAASSPLLDPQRAGRLSVLDAMALANAPLIDSYYLAAEGPALSASPNGGGGSSEPFVPVFSPTVAGDSPRLGKPIRAEDPVEGGALGAEASPRPLPSPPAASTPTTLGTLLRAASPRPERPPIDGGIKQALKRASVVAGAPSPTSSGSDVQAVAAVLAPAPAAGPPSVAPSAASPAVPASPQSHVHKSSGASAPPAVGSSSPPQASSSSGGGGLGLGAMLSTVLRALTDDERLIEERRTAGVGARTPPQTQQRGSARRDSGTGQGVSVRGSPQTRVAVAGSTPPHVSLEAGGATAGTPTNAPRRPSLPYAPPA